MMADKNPSFHLAFYVSYPLLHDMHCSSQQSIDQGPCGTESNGSGHSSISHFQSSTDDNFSGYLSC